MVFSIVTDSASDIEPDFRESENIGVVPTVIIFGEDEVFRDTDITQKEFLDRLNAGQIAKTSQPSLEDFDKEYKAAGDRSEEKEVLAIHLSSKLSGTFNSANITKNQLEDYNIEIFDTENVSVGAGYFIYLAVFLRKNGKSMKETIEILEKAKDSVHIEVYIERIDHLKRSGRINTGQFSLLRILGLKPILNCVDGLLVKKGLVRGKKGALKKVGKRIRALEHKFGSKPVLIIGHANTPEVLELLEEEIKVIEKSQLIRVGICNTLVVHTGPEPFGIGIAPNFEYFL